MDSLKLTQEEIAKQFQLPERKSKIATLLKKDGRVFCICNSADRDGFMIGCDLCDNWYHGGCVGISENDSKNIKRYYCKRCQGHDPSLKTVYSRKSSSAEVRKETKGKSKKGENSDPAYKPPTKKSVKVACGSCANCRSNSGMCKSYKKKFSQKIAERCTNPISEKKKLPAASSKAKDYEVSTDEELRRTVAPSARPGMQCLGPGCIDPARPNSKYCSDKCGMKLATNRIFQVLPQRLQEWSMSPSHAEATDKRDLEEVRHKQNMARASLTELDKRYEHLEALIARGKALEPCFGAESEEAQKLFTRKTTNLKKRFDKEEEASIYCVTCGHEIHTSSAVKHMEKCFYKYESHTSFGSLYKTRVDVNNNVFCDFFNPVNKTYCKRLRVLCPEHVKEPIIGNNEACGFPLVQNVFEETGKLCNFPKKLCFKHFNWGKLRRAELDMERVRLWVKLDELVEKEIKIRQRLVERAGVLALMLHSTYDHDAMETMSTAQEEERLAQLERTLRENYDKEQFENISKETKKFVKTLQKKCE